MLADLLTQIAQLPAGLWTLLGMLITGAIGWVHGNRGHDREDRSDYREELRNLKERLDKVEREVMEWRRRYYREQEYAIRLRLQLLEAGHEPHSREQVLKDHIDEMHDREHDERADK